MGVIRQARLPAADGEAFRQEVEALLGHLGRAGLKTEDPDLLHCLERIADLLGVRENQTPQAGDPESLERLYQLATSRFRHGDYQRAAVHLTAALKLDPGDARLYRERGEAYRLLCEYENALADFDRALRLGPVDPSLLVSRAIASHHAGQREGAVADCTAALNVDPTNAAAYRTRAVARAELGDIEEALADLGEALTLAPDDDEAAYLRGLLHARQRDLAQAIADFNQTLRRNPYHVPALLHRGHCHRLRGDQPAAIRDYTEVLRQHPGNVPAHSGRGLACKLAGDLDRALTDFTEAIHLEPGRAQDHYQRGLLYRARGELEQALADLDETLRLQPDNWPALYYRGKIHLAQGRFALALLDLTEVTRLEPTLLAGHLSKALTHDRLGQYAEGLADASRAIERDANSPAAYLVRGVVQAHRGDRPAAIADLGEAIRLDERFALAYLERSMASVLEGDHDRALADCNRLIALEPGNAQAYAGRSIVYHLTGDVQAALADYTRALQLDPHCILTAWNPTLAESARSRTTQQIADYIDGLRPQPPSVEPPPPLLERPVARPTPTERPGLGRKRTPRRGSETITVELTREPTVVDLPVQAEPLPLAEDAVEASAAEVLSAPSEVPEEPLTLVVRKDADGVDRPAAEKPTPITCPNCERPTTPTPLPEGRGRCGHCKSVFPLAAAATGRPATRKKRVGAGQPPWWRKPLPLGVGIAAALLLSLAVLGPRLFGSSHRVRVHPARGKVELDGKPIPNASIFLHPVGQKNPAYPRPRAVVAEDGTFVLGTYRKGDGAPAGEYKVTVQWFGKVNGDKLTNLLPPGYALAESSSLTLRIQNGENQLPPIRLTRQGR